MDKMINIPSSIDDPKYRYKMPRLNLKIESKGNGIKTNIVNLTDVAKHLHTSEEYILKFFGYEKATQTTVKDAGKNNKNYIINGEFRYDDILKILDKFIEKYICCPKCKYPEMFMFISNDRINGKCESCPYMGELDNKHKIIAFMLKNPPTYKGKAAKMTEKEIKPMNIGKEKPTKVQPKVEEKVEVEETFKDRFNPADLEFGSKELGELIEHTRKYIDERKGNDIDITSAELVSQLKPLGLKKPIYAYIIFNSFFTINIAKQVKGAAQLYRNVMKKLAGNVELETMLNLQYMLLEANKEKDMTKYISTIMMKLNEVELLGEEFLAEWEKGIPEIEKNYLFVPGRDEEFRKASADFLEWLKEGDDDGDEEQ